jgi:hypothetical protein
MKSFKEDKIWINKLENLLHMANHKVVMKWIYDAILHVSEYFPEIYHHVKTQMESIDLWIQGTLKTIDLKTHAYLCHDLARKTDDLSEKYFYRACGHACASAHVKEYAIKASTYLIKSLDELKKDVNVLDKERNFQYQLLLNLSIKA